MEVTSFTIPFIKMLSKMLRSWYIGKFHIDVTLMNTYETPYQGFYAKLQIVNKSAKRISIIGLSIDDIQYNSTGKMTIHGKETDSPSYNQVIPFDIEDYGAEKFCLHFRTNKRLEDFDDIVILTVHTSRGNHNVKVNIKDVGKDLVVHWA